MRRGAAVPWRERSAARHAEPAGFTLVELIMTLVIVGILAVFVLPLIDLTSWRLRAFADDLRAQAMDMQRLALAQRRPVVMSISPTGVSFDYVAGGALLSLPCPAGTSPCIAEAGTRTATFNAGNSGATVTSTGAALPITVGSGAGVLTFQLEADTGLLRGI